MAGPESETVKPKGDGPKSEAAKASPAAGDKDPTKYVGTPAVGTSKAAPAGGVASVGPEPSEANEGRRRLEITSSMNNTP